MLILCFFVEQFKFNNIQKTFSFLYNHCHVVIRKNLNKNMSVKIKCMREHQPLAYAVEKLISRDPLVTKVMSTWNTESL